MLLKINKKCLNMLINIIFFLDKAKKKPKVAKKVPEIDLKKK